jgi:hypothetical protein
MHSPNPSRSIIKAPIKIAAKSAAVAVIAGISLTFYQSHSGPVDKVESTGSNRSSPQLSLHNTQDIELDSESGPI